MTSVFGNDDMELIRGSGNVSRAAAYREFRQLALSQVERGPTRQDIRQAVADILKAIDTNPTAFWERDQSSGMFRS